MKKLLIAGAALAALTGTPALAADMALKAPPPPPPPTMTWTGCYVGIEGGGQWGSQKVVDSSDVAPPDAGATVTTVKPSGGLFGGTVGCNYQSSNFVFGVENDLSWSGLRGSAFDQPPFAVTFSHSVRTTWLDTLRGRVGITVNDNKALLYVTGGGAFTNINDTVTGGGFAASNTTTASGWTGGGGVEVMLAPHWSGKVEYLYARFQNVNDAFNTAPPAGFFVGVNTRLTDNILRAGVNWHF